MLIQLSGRSGPVSDDIRTADLESLLARAGLRLGSWCVHKIQHRPGGRSLLRLIGPDRRSLKVRSFPSASGAAAMVHLRGLIGKHPGFSRVLACWGPLVLEEWVDGHGLTDGQVSTAQARACGVLLAALHQIPLSGRPSEPPLSHLVEQGRTRLQELDATGALTPAEVTRLDRELQAGAPTKARQGLIHFDFCGENLVWTGSRGAVSIDNEKLRLGPFASDIGRTMALWGLPLPVRRAFLAGYGAAGGPAEEGDRAFWLLLALVTSAWFRVRHDPATAKRPLVSLRTWGRPPQEDCA